MQLQIKCALPFLFIGKKGVGEEKRRAALEKG
jgi:hypothetical protein